MRTSPRFAVPFVIGVLLTACSGSGESPEGSVEASRAATSAGESDEGLASSTPTPGSVLETSGPYNQPEGSWSAGMVHLEVMGDVTVVLDLPLASGETSGGRTTFMFENYDEAKEEYSIGAVTISLVLENDSIYVDAGDLKVLGGCNYTFDRAAERDLAGDFTCDEDMQASLGGSPVGVSVTGSLSAS